jgi:uncharacterized protein YegL
MVKLEDLLPGEIRYPQEMKCPVCLLLDISGSMAGEPITRLNRAISDLKTALLSDDKAKKTVELCVITFGGLVTPYPFCTVEDFNPPSFDASGDTPMGEAVLLGLDLVEKRKEQYKAQGVNKYRPWMVIITDGAPTDMDVGDKRWIEVEEGIRNAETGKKIIGWAFGVPGANFQLLNKLFSHQELEKRRVYDLEGYDYRGLFQWLSDSLSLVSRSKEGERIKVDTPPANKIELEV